MKLRSFIAAVMIAAPFLYGTSLPSRETAGRDFAAVVTGWGDSLALDGAVAEQIAMYSREEDDLGENYPATLADRMRRLLLDDAARALSKLPTGPGDPAVEVQFLDAGFANDGGAEPDDGHQRDFEKGFIRIESFAFIPAVGVAPEQVLELFTSPQFRMDVSSRIKRIWPEDRLSCIEVGGVTAILSPTLACNHVDVLIEPGIASEHSQVVAARHCV
jgi:hypothetical protein